MLKERGFVTGLPEIDPDEVDRRLADGWTLPSSLYTDPAVARLEEELIWKPAWQIVGTVADFRSPGDFLTAKLGKFPVLVVRGKDGELRAFLNVCRHRGALVVGGEQGDTAEGVAGNCNRFPCRYHGWTYDLDGKLVGVPEFKLGNIPSFDELGLHPVSVDTWGGVVFVSIEPAEPLETFLGDVPHVAELKNYKAPFEDEEVQLGTAFEFEVQANWKLFQENNLECYHCATTHSETFSALFRLDHQNFCNLSFKNGNHIGAPFGDKLDQLLDPDAAAKLQGSVEATKELPFSQFWLFPGNMITHGVGLGTGVYRIAPVDVNSCRMAGRIYARPGELEEASRLEAFTSSIVVEDMAVSAAVQIGLRSGAREWGPLLDGREESIKWISAQVWSRLAPGFRQAQAAAAMAS